MNIENIRNLKSLVFGDYMVDKYIEGNVKRISPEAPVPIIEVTSKRSKLGGAGNVVDNIIALGSSARALGYIGNDENGNWIINKLEEIGVDSTYIKLSDDRQTISKTRITSKGQQFLRCDEENIEKLPFEYFEYVKENIENILLDIDFVIISDYNKGTVTEELSQLIINSAKNKKIPIIVDPKGNNYNKYIGATICTPNTNELAIVSNKVLDSEENISTAAKQICNSINFDYLALTRSEKGISLFRKNSNHQTDFPAVPKEVIDVTGAGDTVVSIMGLLYSLNFPIEECCRIANIAASISISKSGASTVTLNELVRAISSDANYKVIDKDIAKFIVNDLKDKEQKIVFTNGCYDLFHAGHLASLKKAKSMGNVLIVAINSDASVKRLKGDLRPIISQDRRIELICAIDCVDYVIVMEEDDPVNLIKAIKPDILVKGADWKDKFIPEKEVIESMGGKIEFIDLEQGYSTSEIIKKILTIYSDNNK